VARGEFFATGVGAKLCDSASLGTILKWWRPAKKLTYAPTSFLGAKIRLKICPLESELSAGLCSDKFAGIFRRNIKMVPFSQYFFPE
jgi:hypothetical protein